MQLKKELMKTNKTNDVSVNNSTDHIADNNSAIDIDFLRLTTDICYVIGGFFVGKFPDCKTFIFMNDLDKTVLLNVEEKFILSDDRLSRASMLALETIAFDNDYGFDIFTEED